MKKHSEWRKSKNRARRLYKAVNAVVRRDDARAKWFNDRFAKMKERACAIGFPNIWYIDGQYPASDWPPLDDMFVEVSEDNRLSITERGGVPAGLYVVRGRSRVWSQGVYDALLNVQNVDTGAEELMWFPRMGHRVVSCGEVGDRLWAD
jgi:hypothetical protein|nr:MAG TPA: hypothetical protein [Caudoviricetes sp.]